MKCPVCRKAEMTTQRENHRYVESGLPNVTLLNVEVRHCPNCGERHVPISRLEDLHRTIAFAIAEQPARMSGAEVRFLRKWLGWESQEFAHVMGVAAATVSRWENDKEPIGGLADRLLRLMVVRGAAAEFPTERLGDVAKGDAPRRELLGLRSVKTGWEEQAGF